MKINLRKKSFGIFLIILSFTLGFLYRQSNPTYLFSLKKNIGINLKKVFNSQNIINQKNICPKKISNLPENSTLIIGHAYGSHKKSDLRGNIGISPKVYDFYLKNRNKITSIIFSGDVLKEPSIKKWKDFYSKFRGDTKIYIAPGNHDIGGKVFDSPLRDVF